MLLILVCHYHATNTYTTFYIHCDYVQTIYHPRIHRENSRAMDSFEELGNRPDRSWEEAESESEILFNKAIRWEVLSPQ